MAYLPNQPSSRLGVAQNVTAAATQNASAAFDVQTRQIRVVGYGANATFFGYHIRIGDGTPTAVVADTFMAANQSEYFTATPGQKIAVIRSTLSTTDGTVSVTEIV